MQAERLANLSRVAARASSRLAGPSGVSPQVCAFARTSLRNRSALVKMDSVALSLGSGQVNLQHTAGAEEQSGEDGQ
ncbi:TPA: hypothetical protein ACH3X1_016541 [Trebouxia sp. C0004]